MKKILLLTTFTVLLIALSACTQSVITCGEGTVIKDGQCVAPNQIDDETENTENELNCDSVEGDIFYQADFETLKNVFVDNEAANPHTKDNFVIWGKNESNQLVDEASVQSGVLTISNLTGTQLKPYYDTGLGYQYFNFDTDTSYTVCAIIEGPANESITSEIGIFYGHGTKDEFQLTGEPQLVIQTFKPTLTTNVDFGQYVLFLGRITGEVKVHSILIKSQVQ